MEHPVRVAFCPVFFGKNGGKFNERGLPVFNDPDEDGESPRGKCDIAFDCGLCPYLAEWVSSLVQDGWVVGWECVACISVTKKPDEANGLLRSLPGYYQEGRDPDSPFPDLPGFNNTSDDHTPLKGCTRCGWSSSLLQLVLRRPRGGP